MPAPSKPLAHEVHRLNRVVVLPFAAALVLIAVYVWVRFIDPSPARDDVELGGMIALFVAIMGALVYGKLRFRARVTEFILRPIGSRLAFVAPHTARHDGTITVMHAWNLGFQSMILLEEHDYNSGLWLGMRLIVGTIAVALLTVLLVGYRLGSNEVALTPDGISMPAAFGSRFVPWDALSTGPAREPLSAYVHDRAKIRKRGLVLTRPARLEAQSRLVHPGFITYVIGYYAEHPEHRAAIGTPEEYARLRTQLGLAS